jgi:hypothetical protein
MDFLAVALFQQFSIISPAPRGPITATVEEFKSQSSSLFDSKAKPCKLSKAALRQHFQE